MSDIRALRARHFGATEIDLKDVQFTKELLACVPAEHARRYRVLPVLSSPDKLCLALADPSDIGAIDETHKLLGLDLEIWVADAGQLDEFIERFYGSRGKP